MANEAAAERWETGRGDGSGVYLVTVSEKTGKRREKIGDFGEGGRTPGGSDAAERRATLAAAAPKMLATLCAMVQRHNFRAAEENPAPPGESGTFICGCMDCTFAVEAIEAAEGR